MRPITPCLWFNGNAVTAAKFYVKIFPHSKIHHITAYDPAGAKIAGLPVGSPLTVAFTLMGQEYFGLNGGPQFPLTEAISLIVYCKTQKEIDTYTRKLTAGGGQIIDCGWLKDRFGLVWQVVPEKLLQWLHHRDAARRNRMLAAVRTMKKLNLAKLEAAFNGR